MKLSQLNNLYLTITDNVFHYFAKAKPDQYIVYAEDSEAGSSYADDKKEFQVIEGTTDYFTTIEFDPNVKDIQDIMTVNEIVWKLNSVQYEEDTGYIHYEWLWEVDNIG